MAPGLLARALRKEEEKKLHEMPKPRPFKKALRTQSNMVPGMMPPGLQCLSPLHAARRLSTSNVITGGAWNTQQ